MRASSSWVLLIASSSLTLAAAGRGLPRGVGPEYASYYQDEVSFACIGHADVKLSPSQINDNSCDCPDGSDEPGTAACAHLDPRSPRQPLPGSHSGSTNTTNALPGFWCANEGHVGAYVPFFYVNDGVCDYDLCCDGSEEFAHKGGVVCGNRCAEIGRQHRRKDEERRRSFERAGWKRKTMVQEALDLRRRAEANLASLHDEIARLEMKRNQLQVKYAELEQQDKGRTVRAGQTGGKVGVLVSLARARVEELRGTLDKVLQQRRDAQRKVDELEGMLRKLKDEYNPNFNDEGVKAAIRSFEEYAAREITAARDDRPADSDIEDALAEDTETRGVHWAEFEEEDGSDTDILYDFEAYMPSFARKVLHQKLDALRVWLIENGLLADKSKPGGESQLVRAAREAFEASEREVNDKMCARDKEQDDLNKDYGPSDVFRALTGKCVSLDSGEYTYELCWMGKASQHSKKGHGNTIMGHFQSIDRAMVDDEDRVDGKSLGQGERMVLRYGDGQQCWNGPRRRTDVWLGCAETEEIWRVSEAEKCVYKMEIGTPAACDSLDAGDPHGPAAAASKDEL